jgi:16S rRNA (uracil1498-N3)-methyltransferase
MPKKSKNGIISNVYMKIHRFYYPFLLEKSLSITQEPLLKQLIGVLRIESGEHIRLFNGSQEKEYKIVIASKKLVTGVFVQNHVPLPIPKNTTVGVGITKKNTFELIAQKATEIGVIKLVPLITERTIKKDISVERLQKIIIEATEQSGRCDVMELSPVITLSEFLEQYPETIIFDTLEHESSKIPPSSSVCLIGPEGGWSEKERALFKEKNIVSHSLGHTVLRTETAAIVGMHRLLWN